MLCQHVVYDNNYCDLTAQLLTPAKFMASTIQSQGNNRPTLGQSEPQNILQWRQHANLPLSVSFFCLLLRRHNSRLWHACQRAFSSLCVSRLRTTHRLTYYQFAVCRGTRRMRTDNYINIPTTDFFLRQVWRWTSLFVCLFASAFRSWRVWTQTAVSSFPTQLHRNQLMERLKDSKNSRECIRLDPCEAWRG